MPSAQRDADTISGGPEREPSTAGGRRAAVPLLAVLAVAAAALLWTGRGGDGLGGSGAGSRAAASGSPASADAGRGGGQSPGQAGAVSPAVPGPPPLPAIGAGTFPLRFAAATGTRLVTLVEGGLEAGRLLRVHELDRGTSRLLRLPDELFAPVWLVRLVGERLVLVLGEPGNPSGREVLVFDLTSTAPPQLFEVSRDAFVDDDRLWLVRRNPTGLGPGTIELVRMASGERSDPFSLAAGVDVVGAAGGGLVLRDPELGGLRVWDPRSGRSREIASGRAFLSSVADGRVAWAESCAQLICPQHVVDLSTGEDVVLPGLPDDAAARPLGDATGVTVLAPDGQSWASVLTGSAPGVLVGEVAGRNTRLLDVPGASTAAAPHWSRSGWLLYQPQHGAALYGFGPAGQQVVQRMPSDVRVVAAA